ncbi:MAG: hypothetical protein ACP5N2_04215 [Candidatus Nanoarchaeia archaeon]
MAEHNNDKKLWDLHEECINFMGALDDPLIKKIIPVLMSSNLKNDAVSSIEISAIKTAQSTFEAHLALLKDFVAAFGTKIDLRINSEFKILLHSLEDLRKYLKKISVVYKQNKGKHILLGQQLNILNERFVGVRGELFIFNRTIITCLNDLDSLGKQMRA